MMNNEEISLPEVGKPLPSFYTLFEDKPYLDIIRKKITEKTPVLFKVLKEEIKQRQKAIKQKIKRLLIQVYLDSGIIDENEARMLENMPFKEVELYLKNKGGKLDINKVRNLLEQVTELHYEYFKLREASLMLESDKEQFERRKQILAKLLDMLELYPKHLRFGNLSDFEVKALRFITDTYFTMFSRSLVFGDPRGLEVANFIILPFILNIQETSLSKDAFFLKLVHGSPLTSEIAGAEEVPEEEIEEEQKETALGRILGIFQGNKSNDENVVP